MAITPSDFSKIWASNADTPEYTFGEADYLKGWDFVGNLPPTRAQWNAIQKSTDEKMKYVFDNFGAPLTASTVAGMTMQNRVYVYTGSETGYTAGHWYYWNGSAWTDGGVYNSTAFSTDTTLTISGQAADAKATGDAVAEVRAEASLFGIDDLLWDNTNPESKTQSGVTFTVDKINKTVAISGTATGGNASLTFLAAGSIPAWLQLNKKYYVHMQTDTSAYLRVSRKINGTWNYSFTTRGVSELTLDSSVTNISIEIVVLSGNTVNTVVRPFISESLSLVELENEIETKYVDTMKRMTILPKNTDLNGITETGFYFLNANYDYSNTPIVKNVAALMEVYSIGSNIVIQKLTTYASIYPAVFIRRRLAGTWNDWKTQSFSQKMENEENAFELYTDFTLDAGWWSSSGGLYLTDSRFHTELLKVRPSTTYYIGQKITSELSFGAFFDETGTYISSLLDEDLTQYMYQIADGVPGASRSGYAGIYTFTTPANATYFSLNYWDGELRNYRNYVCSKPIFMLVGSGNYVLKKSDPLLQRWKTKKLCVIGSSNTMIDRLFRPGSNDDFNQCVVGFQEYLFPYFDAVVSYGYSGASWHKYDVEDGASVRSIYSRIVTDQLDLSGYDVFLLMQSGNHLGISNIGAVTSPTDLGDATTYVGGMRQVIDYIYSQNPQALVFVSGIRWREEYTLGYACNEEVKKMANFISCPYIDLWNDLGLNQYNRDLYSYDGGNHCNQLGNKLIGEAIRKAIIGI